ncbi:hypothetical protein T492DRAFT_863913 [Pavlovales sp. CCMP2436]|nr:hypothetical protein T492DRAFT_863913 [Pavlovales sp. CCMP2436]
MWRPLLATATKSPGSALKVDLPSQTITRPGGAPIVFEMDAFRKHCLLNGLDDIALTLQKGAKIDAYEKAAKLSMPWL